MITLFSNNSRPNHNDYIRFLHDVAAVDSPAACEDDGELLRLSSFLLIGSTATSSVTTIITSVSFHFDEQGTTTTTLQ